MKWSTDTTGAGAKSSVPLKTHNQPAAFAAVDFCSETVLL